MSEPNNVSLEDLRYGEGWAFFVADNKDISLLKDDIQWCLGWLAAYAEYGSSYIDGYQKIEQCVYGEYGKSEISKQFVTSCKNAVAWVNQQDEFFRLPTVKF